MCSKFERVTLRNFSIVNCWQLFKKEYKSKKKYFVIQKHTSVTDAFAQAHRLLFFEITDYLAEASKIAQ